MPEAPGSGAVMPGAAQSGEPTPWAVKPGELAAAEAALDGEDFRRFVAPGTERLVALAGMLARRGLSWTILPLAGRRHLLVRLGAGRPRVVLVAHYDRFPGSAGALDNGAACLALAELGSRLSRGPKVLPPLALLFTDGEEAPAGGDPRSQGSYSLAGALSLVWKGRAQPPVLVLDVVGRGNRLILSRAPAEALARSLARSATVEPRASTPRTWRPTAGQGEPRSPALRRLVLLEELALQAAGEGGLAPPLRLALPWSDDLGFLLGGFPALALSLLPAAEAEAFLREGVRPATWGLLHGPGDSPSVLEPLALALVARFLDALTGL